MPQPQPYMAGERATLGIHFKVFDFSQIAPACSGNVRFQNPQEFIDI
jgi:hypothetical protein